MNKVACKGCGEEIDETEIVCPACGSVRFDPKLPSLDHVGESLFRQVPLWAAAVPSAILLLVVVMLAVGRKPSPTTSSKPTAKEQNNALPTPQITEPQPSEPVQPMQQPMAQVTQNPPQPVQQQPLTPQPSAPDQTQQGSQTSDNHTQNGSTSATSEDIEVHGTCSWIKLNPNRIMAEGHLINVGKVAANEVEIVVWARGFYVYSREFALESSKPSRYTPYTRESTHYHSPVYQPNVYFEKVADSTRNMQPGESRPFKVVVDLWTGIYAGSEYTGVPSGFCVEGDTGPSQKGVYVRVH